MNVSRRLSSKSTDYVELLAHSLEASTSSTFDVLRSGQFSPSRRGNVELVQVVHSAFIGTPSKTVKAFSIVAISQLMETTGIR